MGYFLQPTAPTAREPRPAPVDNSRETAKTEVPQFFTVNSGRRFYSSELGRWLSRDPIGEQMQINLYGHVDNRPINTFDLLGLVGEGIISLGEIPGVAEKLNALHAKLLNRGVSVSSGTVKKTEFMSWLAKVGPEVFIQLYAQAIYDEMQAQLENVVRDLFVCHVVNMDYAGNGNENGEIEVKEYEFPALTQPWTWNTPPTVKRVMKYTPCPDRCYWRVYYYVPTAKDFSTWKEVERYSCSETPRCRRTMP